MRSTLVAKGIKGIFPLIKSQTPQALSHAFAISALQGLRLAIDATLVVQRLHFADDPHPSRHVIGFYRLISSLRQNGIVPIMVFDHPQKRLALKDREQVKRRHKREVDRIRSQLESERRDRLLGLSYCLEALQSLTSEERHHVGILLQRWQSRPLSEAAGTSSTTDSLAEALAASISDYDEDVTWSELDKALPGGPFQHRANTDVEREAEEIEAVSLELIESLGRRVWTDFPFAEKNEAPSSSSQLTPLNTVSMASTNSAGVEEAWQVALEEAVSSRAYAIALRIYTLWSRFESGLDQLGDSQSKGQKIVAEAERRMYQSIVRQLLPTSEAGSSASQKEAIQTPSKALETFRGEQASAQEMESVDEDVAEAQSSAQAGAEESATSKAVQQSEVQGETTSERAAALLKNSADDTTLEGPEPEADAEEPEASLTTLTSMNTTLSKTYNRATNPLSASIFQDCAKLASLMSVPVFWTGDGTRTGGGRIHEAEAYAASLVRSGFADAVASEDSDVLLYDTILLRGLIGGVKSSSSLGRDAGRKKLEMVSGTRVRHGLFPRNELQQLCDRIAQEGKHRGSLSLTGCGGRKASRWRTAGMSMQKDAAELDSIKSQQPRAPQKLLTDEEYDKMTKSMMLDFALLCGTDFNRTIPGIGPRTALRLLKEHGSISAILRKESKKFQPPNGLSIKEYEAELRDARMVFLNPPKVKNTARNVLGSAAAAQVSQNAESSSQIESTFFPSAEADAEASQAATSHAVEDPLDADAAMIASCTAEPAEASADKATEESYAATEVSNNASDDVAAGDSSHSEPQFDRQAVLEFLRSRGVFRGALGNAPRHNEEPRSQEWRDLLDLELGLLPSRQPQDSESDGGNEQGDLGASLMGSDFFGEGRQAGGRAGVACWKPRLEDGIKRETTLTP